jgi:aspartyl-tRNA(Asn)/glutamyl-tRNA(Gln) amidotransferase subunit B
MAQYGINEYNATVLVMDKGLADFYERVTLHYNNYPKVASLLINDYLRWLNEKDMKISQSKAGPEQVAELLRMLENGTITIKIAKEFLPRMIYEGKSPRELMEATNMTALRDMTILEDIVNQVLAENPEVVKKAKADSKVIHFLVGQVMKKTGKRAEPETVYKLIEEKIARI